VPTLALRAAGFSVSDAQTRAIVASGLAPRSV